jgi:hypothetical protein
MYLNGDQSCSDGDDVPISGTMKFSGIGECGQYEFRYFSSKLRNRLWGTSNAILVVGGCNAFPESLFVRGVIHGIQVTSANISTLLTLL